MLSQSSVIELNLMLSQSSVIELNLILSQSSVNKLNLMLSQSSVIKLKLGLKSQRGPLTQKNPPPPSNWSAAGILGPGLVHFQIMILNDYVSPADGVILKGITDGNGD